MLFKPPLAFRVYTVCFAAFWLALAVGVVTGILEMDVGAGGGMLVAVYLAGLWVILRYARVAVLVSGRVLVVRNVARTRRLNSYDVLSFRSGTVAPFCQVVEARLTNGGTLPLQGTLVVGPATSADRRIQEKVGILKEWQRA